MGSQLSCLKPIFLCGNTRKKEPERSQQHPMQKDDKKENLLDNKKLTLKDYILSSPRSSHLPVTSSKRVCPNPLFVNDHASKERHLLSGCLDAQDGDGGGADDLKTKTKENLLSKGERTKKKVSFRMPEIADVFVLVDSPASADHESSDLQVHDHH